MGFEIDISFSKMVTIGGIDIHYHGKCKDISPISINFTPISLIHSPKSWNSLVGPNAFYSSYEWIHSLELAHGTNPTFLAQIDDKVLGGIPSWRGDLSGDPLFTLSELIGDLPGSWDKQFLWLGGHRVTANSLICTKGEQRSHVIRELIHAVRVYADKHQFSGIVWPYLSLEEACEIARCCPSANFVLHSADPVVHIPADGFQGFLQAARRNDRKKWQKEIKDFQHSGGEVEWKPLEFDVIQLAARLIAANRSKYGSSGGLEWMHRTFSAQLQSGVAKKAIVALSRVGEKIMALAIFYRHHDWLYGRYWGADIDAPPYSYYVLTHYAAVKWAAQHGFRHIHLSISAWESKVRRGAHLYPLAMVIFPPHGKSGFVSESLARKYNKSVVEHWKKRFLTRPEAIDISWSNWA
ncbi:GNAT family N-acetyltransferase [Shimazuella alba]|uniref:GNAT family N-acetyltransferase n=1 Tax=Shimazuella alba TaxID=2690964 RepID=A0A6I4VTU4_9BACL|nr:GNAT family N-acetyltransferase [Shimazuella alba]MXQ55199.1 GNAT family N-acetyltransferase [Shimazuella alba]